MAEPTWSLQNPDGWIPKSIVKIGNEIYVVGERFTKYVSSTYFSFPLLDSLLFNDSLTISSLAVENGTALWIGTDNGKLIKYNENVINTFDLTTESIIDIAIDKSRNKWFLSQEGCFVFNEDRIVEVKNDLPILSEFPLSQNYSNPFNPSTIISFSVPKQTNVKLAVYDVLGKEVMVLVNEEKNVGTYKIDYDADGLASGIYFYRIISGKYSATKKMILLR